MAQGVTAMEEAARSRGIHEPTDPSKLGPLSGSAEVPDNVPLSNMYFRLRDIFRLICVCFDPALYGAIITQAGTDIRKLSRQLTQLGKMFRLTSMVDGLPTSGTQWVPAKKKKKTTLLKLPPFPSSQPKNKQKPLFLISPYPFMVVCVTIFLMN